ncbi:3-methyladenine DNA glycosylase [Pseudactinotalea suaedae]|uniref:3-methyladenine DNA glycosylase n=1 Tax=Pseudactinotalea suaedae TaxID=1524924 RepID=UPI0012E16EF1|nr:3-methyladenine DNA glycosylase [Pseudactinotalea suaedae]
MIVLDEPTWRERADAHAERVDALVADHLARRRDGVPHPVHDFLFSYYSYKPSQLRRWHPGYGVGLAGGAEYAERRGYEMVDGVARVSQTMLAERGDLIAGTHALLVATASRPANTGCFGMHEWAMVYRSEGTRHPHPLRLGHEGTDQVVESHRITCSHFDAYRFFTPAARDRNTLRPRSEDRPAFEQPGCLHAGMDLYKHAFRLSPLISSDLIADCFALARDIRVLDMRAAPYDLADLGFDPVPIETAAGKRTYAAAQAEFAERGAPLRTRLIEACDALLACRPRAGVTVSSATPA